MIRTALEKVAAMNLQTRNAVAASVIWHSLERAVEGRIANIVEGAAAAVFDHFNQPGFVIRALPKAVFCASGPGEEILNEDLKAFILSLSARGG
jgi:hypothetical protein